MFVFAITDPYLRIVTTVLAALIGLCVGSFLNVVIYRVPLHMSLASPPSHCPACGYRLRPYDNIPILSYIMLRGRCRQCGTHISFRYTAVEAANMLLWTLCALLFADNIGWMVLSAVSVSVCICIAFVDLEHTEIPDRFQVALALPAIAVVNIKGNRFAVKRKGLLTFERGAGGGNGFFVPLGSQFPVSVNGMSVELVSIDEYKKTQRINSLLLKFAVDYDKICGRLVIRNRMPGDKIRPVGRNVTKSFKKLFNENNIPEDLREALPVLADDNGVLWLYGFGADARAAVDASTKRVLLMGKVPNLEV